MKKSPGRIVAEKIASRTGEPVKTFTVKMVGGKAVENLLTKIEQARTTSKKTSWQLD